MKFKILFFIFFMNFVNINFVFANNISNKLSKIVKAGNLSEAKNILCNINENIDIGIVERNYKRIKKASEQQTLVFSFIKEGNNLLSNTSSNVKTLAISILCEKDISRDIEGNKENINELQLINGKHQNLLEYALSLEQTIGRKIIIKKLRQAGAKTKEEIELEIKQKEEEERKLEEEKLIKFLTELIEKGGSLQEFRKILYTYPNNGYCINIEAFNIRGALRDKYKNISNAKKQQRNIYYAIDDVLTWNCCNIDLSIDYYTNAYICILFEELDKLKVLLNLWKEKNINEIKIWCDYPESKEFRLLDYAMTVCKTPEKKQEIIKLLKQYGAKTTLEIEGSKSKTKNSSVKSSKSYTYYTRDYVVKQCYEYLSGYPVDRYNSCHINSEKFVVSGDYSCGYDKQYFLIFYYDRPVQDNAKVKGCWIAFHSSYSENSSHYLYKMAQKLQSLGVVPRGLSIKSNKTFFGPELEIGDTY